METIRILTSDELPAAWALDQQVFNVDPVVHQTARDPDSAECRVGVFDGNQLLATAEFLRFGQFFRGRRVAMGGVAGVAVAPEARGRGLASRMMKILVERMRIEGLPISALFPATPTLYRSLGYEFAGHWTRYSMPLTHLRGVARQEDGRVRRANANDLEEMEALRVRLSADRNGALDRGRWAVPIYRRRFEGLKSYVSIDEHGAIDGALIYQHTRLDGQPYDYDLDVRELFAANDAALSALLWVAASSSSVARNAVYRGWPDDEVAWLVPEQRASIVAQKRWMLRILDLPSAIAARGGPPGFTASVPIRLRDDLIRFNDGGFVLHFADGRAEVKREDTLLPVQLDVGALSSLYAGHTTCAALARAGRLTGGDPKRDWAALDAAFAGASPAMVDEF